MGGGSDGNLTAAVGVRTLDGLGAVGACAHAETEHVQLDAMPERAALVAGLVQSIVNGLRANAQRPHVEGDERRPPPHFEPEWR